MSGRETKNAEAALDPAQSFRSAMETLIAQRWANVWKAVPVALAGDDIEGVHDVRVASRRLRAAMDVAVDCFPDDWYRPLHRTAKAITDALGEVRDRDVLLDHLAKEHLAAKREEWPGLDCLIERVETERAAARRDMEAFLRDLIASGVADEAVRHFGERAAPPRPLTAGDTDDRDAAEADR